MSKPWNKNKKKKEVKKKVIDPDNMLLDNVDISDLPSVDADDLKGNWEDIKEGFLDILSDVSIQKKTIKSLSDISGISQEIKEEINGVLVNVKHLEERIKKYFSKSTEEIGSKTGEVDQNDPDVFFLWMQHNQTITDLQSELAQLVSIAFIDIIPKIDNSKEVSNALTDLSNDVKDFKGDV